jgi:dTDP-4-dehydrorhamnose 3,5-epimerase-like enzyme
LSSDINFIAGGLAIDDRGKLQFCNDFDMSAVRRFYVVSNHAARFVRAWHGHKIEEKYVYVASGAALVCAVRVDDWRSPDRELEISRFVLAEEKPGVLRVPGGYAHGFMTLQPDTRVIFYSTAGLDESLDDDFRFAFDTWDPWTVVPR